MADAIAPFAVASFHTIAANNGTATQEPTPLNPKYRKMDRNSGGLLQVRNKHTAATTNIDTLVMAIMVFQDALGLIDST